MATQCGGIKLDDNSLTTVNGVICKAGTSSVSSVVTACGGQQFDGAVFTPIKLNNGYLLTCGELIGEPVIVQANCGLGVDGRFFTFDANGGLGVKDGYILNITTIPATATITVTDSNGDVVEPIGTTKEYLVSGSTTVKVEAAGYATSTQTIAVTKNQTLNITLNEAVELTVSVTTPDSGATITVEDAYGNSISPKSGTTNIFVVGDTQTYAVSVSADGYVTNSQNVEIDGNTTVTVALEPVTP